MKKNFVVFSVLLFLPLVTACAAVTDLLGATATDSDSEEISEEVTTDLVEFEQEGISFAYLPELAGGTRLERIEATPPDQWFANPEYLQIAFEDHLHDQHFITASLNVFPLEEYRAVSAYADETISTLEAILDGTQKKVDLYELPFLPESNAAQIINAGAEALHFPGGSGLRYMTQYAQDVTPVVNDALFYTFQGLTEDRRYYVSFIYPLAHPNLAGNLSVYFEDSGSDYQAFEAEYVEYIEETISMLDTANQDQFTPPLGMLDDLVRSLTLR